MTMPPRRRGKRQVVALDLLDVKASVDRELLALRRG